MITPYQQKQLDHVNALTVDNIRIILLPGHPMNTPHTHVMVHKDRARQLITNGHAQLDEITFYMEERIAKLEAAK